MSKSKAAAGVKGKKAVATIGISGTGKSKASKPEPAKQPSNKERVYKLYLKSTEKSPKEAEDLMAKAKVDVKLNTVRGWISAWNNGKNLPGCAKEE
jgi:hypothetical protein